MPSNATRILALEQQQDDEREEGHQQEQNRRRALTQGQGGLGETLGETHQLRGVLGQPLGDVVLVQQVADPPLVVFGLAHDPRQGVCEMGDGVHQWIPEGHGETDKGEDRKRHDDEDRRAAPRYLPLLEHVHQRVKDQRDEPTNQHEQQDVAQSIEDEAEKVDQHDHEDRRQDRAEGNVEVVGAFEESRATRRGAVGAPPQRHTSSPSSITWRSR